jgi:hypothetical protein
MNRFEDMVVENDEEEIPISDELVQEQILNMLHLHFRLSNCHAHDAECRKSEFEALQSTDSQQTHNSKQHLPHESLY